MDVLRWPSQAPSVAERIAVAWDRKFRGEVLETFLLALKMNAPGPDTVEHPDNDDGTDLYGGDCYCHDCWLEY